MAEEKPQPSTEPGVPASFSSLVLSLALAALQVLEESGKPDDKPRDHRQAKPMIDSLEILKDKTKGNLTPDEAALLDSVLLDVRLRYLKADARPAAPGPSKEQSPGSHRADKNDTEGAETEPKSPK
jgi:hypothetical protein